MKGTAHDGVKVSLQRALPSTQVASCNSCVITAGVPCHRGQDHPAVALWQVSRVPAEERGLQVLPRSACRAPTSWREHSSSAQLLRRRRIEIIQDLEFPAACHRLKLSPDGQFLVATGTHPPRVSRPWLRAQLLGAQLTLQALVTGQSLRAQPARAQVRAAPGRRDSGLPGALLGLHARAARQQSSLTPVQHRSCPRTTPRWCSCATTAAWSSTPSLEHTTSCACPSMDVP